LTSSYLALVLNENTSAKEKTMDAKSYCNSVGIELTGWKAKLYDVIRKTDSLSTEDQKKVGSTIAELHELVDDLNERIELLSRECPAEWSGHKAEIESKMAQMKDRWKTVWGVMGEKEYGIGGA
jgi:hypothetical protein